MSRKRLLTMLLGIMLFITGCTNSGLPVTESMPSVTLPPAVVEHAAPIGDASLEYTETASLFLPAHEKVAVDVESAHKDFFSVEL